MTDLYVKVTSSFWDLKHNIKPRHHSMMGHSQFLVEYLPGEWAHPETPFPSKLFIFKDLAVCIENVKLSPAPEIADYFEGTIAWWCEAIKPFYPTTFLWGPPDDVIQQYWQVYERDGFIGSKAFARCYYRRGTGTMMADAVKLVSCVTVSDIRKAQNG
jgi:hypothetical protein